MRTRLSCVLLFLAACGGNSVSIDDLPTALVSAECEFLVRCHAYPTADQCNRDTALDVGQIVASTNAGRVSYDANLAGDCLDTLKNAACRLDDFSAASNAASCRHAITGTVPANGACFENNDCAGGGSCTYPQGCTRATQCCAGTCGAGRPSDVPVGQACTTTNNCVENAYCAPPPVGGQVRTCKDKIAADGGACDASDACASPLRCLSDPAPATTRSCRRPADEGQACDPRSPAAARSSTTCAAARPARAPHSPAPDSRARHRPGAWRRLGA